MVGILCKDWSKEDNTVADGVLSDVGVTNKLKRSTRSAKQKHVKR
jgi:hypothetical protein